MSGTDGVFRYLDSVLLTFKDSELFLPSVSQIERLPEPFAGRAEQDSGCLLCAPTPPPGFSVDTFRIRLLLCQIHLLLE